MKLRAGQKEVQPSSGKLPCCAACWCLPSRGMLHIRAPVCSRGGERDMAQILTGSGPGSSETFGEQAKVQQNWEKGWQD